MPSSFFIRISQSLEILIIFSARKAWSHSNFFFIEQTRVNQAKQWCIVNSKREKGKVMVVSFGSRCV